MSDTQPMSVSSLPEAANIKGGSTRDMMIALTKSGHSKEAIYSSYIASLLENDLSSPVEADIRNGMSSIETIQKQFNEISNPAIRENKATYTDEAQKCTAEAAVLAAELQDQMRAVEHIRETFLSIIPGLSVKPLSPETIASCTTLENNISSIAKLLKQVHKTQTALASHIESTIKMGVNLLPETYRNSVSRQLQRTEKGPELPATGPELPTRPE